jgi:hypothetical protein
LYDLVPLQHQNQADVDPAAYLLNSPSQSLTTIFGHSRMLLGVQVFAVTGGTSDSKLREVSASDDGNATEGVSLIPTVAGNDKEEEEEEDAERDALG